LTVLGSSAERPAQVTTRKDDAVRIARGRASPPRPIAVVYEAGPTGYGRVTGTSSRAVNSPITQAPLAARIATTCFVQEIHLSTGRDPVLMQEPAVLSESDTCSSATPRVTAANPSTSSHGLG
jgi:hypothetical protein